MTLFTSPAALLVAASCLAFVACGGDASSMDADSTSGDGSSSGTTEPITTTLGTHGTSGGATDSGDSDPSGPDPSGAEESSGGQIYVGPCEDTPDLPTQQSGASKSNEIWDGSWAEHVVVDGDHRRIIGGMHTDTVTIGGQSIDLVDPTSTPEAFLAVMSEAHELAWLTPIYGIGGQGIDEVGVNAAGDVIASGSFSDYYEQFGGSELIIDGVTYGTTVAGDEAYYVASFDGETGAVRWLQIITASAASIPGNDVVALDDGGAVVSLPHAAGTIAIGDGDPIEAADGVAYLRFDGEGALSWVRFVDTAEFSDLSADVGLTRIDGGFATTLHAYGGVVIDGTTYTDTTLSENAFLIRLDDDGALARVDILGDGNFIDVAPAPCNDLIVVGKSFAGFADLGPGTFATRVTEDGELRWATLLQPGDISWMAGGAVDPAGQTIAAVTLLDGRGYKTENGDFDTVKIDPDGAIVWRKTISAGWPATQDVVLATDGMDGVVMGGGYIDDLLIPDLQPYASDNFGAFVLELSP